MKIHYGRIGFAILCLIGLIGGCAFFAWPYVQPMLPKPVTVVSVPTSAPIVQATAVPAKPTTAVVPTKVVAPPVVVQPPVSGRRVIKWGLVNFESYYDVIVAKQILEKNYNIEIQIVRISETGGDVNWSEADQRDNLKNGTIQFLANTLDPLVLDPPMARAFKFQDISKGADLIVCNPNKVKTINDMARPDVKTATSKFSVGEPFLWYVQKYFGVKVDLNQLRREDSVADAADLFVKGEVACVSGWLPDIQPALDAGGVKLADSSVFIYPIDVLLVNNQLEASNSQLVQDVSDMMFEANKIIFENPDIAFKAIKEWDKDGWTGLDTVDQYKEKLKLVAQATLDDNLAALDNVSARIKEIQNVYAYAGIAVPNVDPSTMFVDKYIKGSVAKSKTLTPKTLPLNPTFMLSSAAASPSKTADSVVKANKAVTIGKLPFVLRFKPGSLEVELTDTEKNQLKDQVAPILLGNDPGLYLRVRCSAAWYTAEITAKSVQDFAAQRCQRTLEFLKTIKVSASRVFLESVLPDKVDPDPENKKRFAEFEIFGGY